MKASVELQKYLDACDRSDLRYKLYRIKNGNMMEGDEELKKYIEKMPGFEGWHLFAERWDVLYTKQQDPGGLTFVKGPLIRPLQIVKRLYSEEEEWNRVVAARAINVATKKTVRDTAIKAARKQKAKDSVKKK